MQVMINEKTKIKASILGTGSYVPEKILSNQDLEKLIDTNDEWIVTRTGVKERRVAAEDQATSDLAYEAAKNALSAALKKYYGNGKTTPGQKSRTSTKGRMARWPGHPGNQGF